jgi:tetratricopeptide (TPR) repeat protein
VTRLSTDALDLLGLYQVTRGNYAEAVAANRHAIEMEPTTAQWYRDLGFFLYASGDTVAARDAAIRAIQLDPTFFEAHHMLAWIESGLGHLDSARSELEKARTLTGGDYYWSVFVDGLIRVRCGDTTGARARLRELDHDSRLSQRAVVLHELGQVDSALTLLEAALATRDVDLLTAAAAIPELHPLRRQPRFQAIGRKLAIRPFE